jgi:hypothetical protein
LLHAPSAEHAMASAAEQQPPESVPPQKRASGAEIAPLAAHDMRRDGAAAEPAEEPAARAEREVEEADELLRKWRLLRPDPRAFSLTVQPVIGGEEAAITLKGVTSNMSVSALHYRVQTEMESHPHPDRQQLFVLDGDKGPLHDETLPIGAYGVVSGVTLNLAMRDEAAAAARRLARGKVRAAQEAAEEAAMEAVNEAARQARAAKKARKRCWTAFLTRTMVVVALGVACGLLVLLIGYFNGCGACENDAACDGLFGVCVCTGNHLGEYCGESCGEYGQVNGSACVCSGNHTGAFCELDALGQIVRDDLGDDSGLTLLGDLSGLGAGWIVLMALIAFGPVPIYLEICREGGLRQRDAGDKCGMCCFVATHLIALALVLLGAYSMRGAGAGWIVPILIIVLLPFLMHVQAIVGDDNRSRSCYIFFAQLTALALVLFGAYFVSGCGACENDSACKGLFGGCVCTGNHLGEYCEESCGEYGQVVNSLNGSACECSGNHTGAFCNLRPGEIAEEDPVSRSFLTTCSAVAVAGCCIVAWGFGIDNPHDESQGDCAGLLFILMFAPAGCGTICVAMTVLAVAAFGGWAGLGMGVGLLLVLVGLLACCVKGSKWKW